ncbi:S1C family serine protease [uncultured Paenibacillus sp.]|uniref:S1C family serine protease n=1 Tax=uncultured Paenibacillus sp. TaxID=227322 RepID=UPI0015A824CA|nr:trypsin-like peptidase domain-containing protein [uncultured Paenibacillus sp.]
MDDQKNKPGQPFEDDANEPKRQESSETGSSYYYSYGPFQSYGKTNEEPGQEPNYERSQPEDVEVTRPQPLKPLPSSYDMIRNVVEPSGGSNGDGGGSLPAAKSNNWQYNSKPPRKSSVRSVIAGVLAGMLIMTGAMVFADRANLFTSDQAASASIPASGSPSNSGGTESTGKATTALYPVTDSGEVTKVVNQTGPAVVKIETLTDASKQSNSNPYSNDPFYRYFFGDDAFGFGGNNGSDGGGNGGNGGSSSGSSQLVPTGIGSGFIFDKTGYILTNEHVVHNADVVQVTVQGTEKPYEAKVLGTSYELDLAVLKIEGDGNFPSIPLGNSDNAQVGEWMVAIGNPQGFDHTVTAGVLSAKERDITIAGENGEKDRQYEHLLQTDASINPGNSGGPLLNLNGEVIGINVAVSSDAQGIGFAIPTSTISEVLDKLKNNEKIPQKPVPFIGATLMTMTEEVAKQMQTDVKEGSIITDIVFKSPAYNADLRPYDIITGANGTKFATKEKLIEYIQKQQVGTKVTLNVVRDGKNIDLEVTIGDKNEFPNVN